MCYSCIQITVNNYEEIDDYLSANEDEQVKSKILVKELNITILVIKCFISY